jgi:HK97 family phage major capsid protein
MNEAIPSQGGFLVRPQMSDKILEKVYNTGTLLALFPRDPVEGNGMSYNVVDETSRADGSRFGGIQGYWLGEGGTKTASKPKFRQLELKLKKVAALCVATDELLEDAKALESWLTRGVPNELRFKVEDAIINGDGVGKPLGILPSPALKSVTRINATSITAVDIGNMWAARYAGAKDYVWIASPTIFPQLMNMSIGNFPVFLAAGGLSGLPYSTLLGRPMYETEYNPTLGEIGDLMLVSPGEYPMIEKSGGIQTASSIHVYFTTDEQAFRFVMRIDGAPSWLSALTAKDGNTVSPYVVLTTST